MIEMPLQGMGRVSRRILLDGFQDDIPSTGQSFEGNGAAQCEGECGIVRAKTAEPT